MHILLAILGFLAAASAWYYRARMIGRAAKDLAGAAQTVASLPRRLGFRRRAGQMGLRGIQDPREASAVMMRLMALAYGGAEPTTAQRQIMRREMALTFKISDEDADVLVDYAGWLVREVEVPHGVMAAMSRIVMNGEHIGARELVELDTMLVALSEAEETPVEAQLRLLQVFRDKSGLRA